MRERTDAFEAGASDAVLVEAVRGGSGARFAEIVQRHDLRVREAVGRILRDRHEREEAVQQTFYLAFKHLDALVDPSRLATWLTRIAQRVSTDRARERARAQAQHAPQGVSDAHAARDTRAGGAAWIWEDVARLARPHAEVLVLRYREGLSYDEIAARLGVPCSTVRGRIHEARRALRRKLAEEKP